MKTNQFQILLQFFKALADESRLKLLGILANQECSVEELAVLLQLKEPTVSHHLSKLKQLNLVTMRAEGNTHLYQLDNEALQGISKEIYTDGDIRLKEIPASRKKRLVILKWLVSKFQIGVEYPEEKVNEILKQYHIDCATLRRELVGYQLMQRENSIYRRSPEA
jgi:hypothetical protein